MSAAPSAQTDEDRRGAKESPAKSADGDRPLDPRDVLRDRVSEAPLREGNRLTLLKNGPQAFDEWLEAIGRAERWVHLENFIFKPGEVGRRFTDALKEKASQGVPTRLLYDHLGSHTSPPQLWRELREAGVHVRGFNPFSLAAPLEIVMRDHRKSLVVDQDYASVGGICIADEWIQRAPDTGLPYRDTSVGLRGPAVADVDGAFRQMWSRCGSPMPIEEGAQLAQIAHAGTEAVRVVRQEPGRMRLARLLQLVTAGVRERLWIADAYFVAGPMLNQALMAAARDGVDVRLLLPATNDVRIVGAISRAGYRQLLQAGVRIFEYGGLMMHAKTSVADGLSARVGSSNLDVSGLLTDYELDVIVESEDFGTQMERMFEDDLADSREIRLDGPPGHVRARPDHHIDRPRRRSPRGPLGDGSGSGTRAIVTAARAGGTAFRDGAGALERYERAAGATVSGALLATAVLGARFPRLLAWPLAAASALLGGSGLHKFLRPRRGQGGSAAELDSERSRR